MKKLFSSAALVSLVMFASSQAVASQDYTVHFKNTSSQTKYVKQLNNQCMSSPKNGTVYTVPPRGDIKFSMTDSNAFFGGCTNGAKEINWAVDGDKSFKVANLTFRHQKVNGNWFTKVSPTFGLPVTITCNDNDCSKSGTPGTPREPSPIVVIFN